MYLDSIYEKRPLGIQRMNYLANWIIRIVHRVQFYRQVPIGGGYHFDNLNFYVLNLLASRVFDFQPIDISVTRTKVLIYISVVHIIGKLEFWSNGFFKIKNSLLVDFNFRKFF